MPNPSFRVYDDAGNVIEAHEHITGYAALEAMRIGQTSTQLIETVI